MHIPNSPSSPLLVFVSCPAQLLDAQLSHAAPWRFLGISVALQLSLASGIWAASASQAADVFGHVRTPLDEAHQCLLVGWLVCVCVY